MSTLPHRTGSFTSKQLTAMIKISAKMSTRLQETVSLAFFYSLLAGTQCISSLADQEQRRRSGRTTPTLGPISFIFTQSSAKILPNNRFCLKLMGSPRSPFPPNCLENPGSTTDYLYLNNILIRSLINCTC